MNTIKLEPKAVFECFSQINQVPRPSKKEGKIIDFLVKFGEKHNLPTRVDEAGNVLITKPATPGYEDRKTTVLQSHTDMVCEKNAGVEFDFENDPIQTEVRGEWLHAKGTTLGADDGIGVAMAMAILQSNEIEHGPLECLFTSDEETGLTGAKELKAGFISGDILINLDSEDEGQIFVSCAGGAGTEGIYDIEREALPDGHVAFVAKISGLLGGHSGDDIDKNRANANKLLLRFLEAAGSNADIRLFEIHGGNLHNAIPREANAVIAVERVGKEALEKAAERFAGDVAEELKSTEPNFKFELLETSEQTEAYEKQAADKMLKSLLVMHNGVYAMSTDMPGLVETSSNLASIHSNGREIKVLTSQRSAIMSARRHISSVIRAAFALGGAKATTADGYPGWKYNPDSEILKISVDSYERLFDKSPQVRAIHAGLECGLFSEKYPQLDMISIGPTLRGVHSPDERMHIPSVDLVWKHLLDILRNIPRK